MSNNGGGNSGKGSQGGLNVPGISNNAGGGKGSDGGLSVPGMSHNGMKLTGTSSLKPIPSNQVQSGYCASSDT